MLRGNRARRNGTVDEGRERRSAARAFIRTLRLDSGDKKEADANARAWRRITFIFIALLVWSEWNRGALERQPTKVFVVQHDVSSGTYIPEGAIKPGDPPTIPDRKVMLAKTLRCMYEISSASLTRQKDCVFAHVASGTEAATFMNAFYSDNATSPFVIAQHNHRAVLVESYDVRSDTVYDVTFALQLLDPQETHNDGRPVRYTAHVELVYIPDLPESQLYDNPERLMMTVFRVQPAPAPQ